MRISISSLFVLLFLYKVVQNNLVAMAYVGPAFFKRVQG